MGVRKDGVGVRPAAGKAQGAGAVRADVRQRDTAVSFSLSQVSGLLYFLAELCGCSNFLYLLLLHLEHSTK